MTADAQSGQLQCSSQSDVETQLQLASLRLEELTAGVVSPRAWWLGEQQDFPDEAAELAALLHEAAPKLAALSGQLMPPGRQQSQLRKARSFELLPDAIRHRLARAVDWSRLVATISSETVRPLGQPDASAAGHSLEINSGGRVLFCLFAPPASPAHTPPSSLVPSPDRGAVPFPRDLPAAGAGWALADSPSAGLMLQQAGAGARAPDAAAAAVGSAGAGSTCAGSSSSRGALAQLEQLAAAIEEVAAEALSPLPPPSADRPPPPPPPAAAHALDAGHLLPLAGAASAAARLAEALGGLADGPPEGCAVVKFVPTRLLCQSEQFASELTRHVGLPAPDSRILRQPPGKGGVGDGGDGDGSEWAAALHAAAAIKQLGFADLHDEMGRSSCCLVMEFIPGRGLFKSEEAFAPGVVLATAQDLGRLFTLDQLLGNSDRLPCDALGWRGNRENVMYAAAGRWAGRLVAIDACVQRRPPGGLVSAEDAACERLSELVLNDAGVARAVLADAVKCSEAAVAAVERDNAVVAAFQQARGRRRAGARLLGLKAALESTMTIKGLLEMMYEVISDWILEFLEDIEGADGVNITPRPAPRRISSAGAGGAAAAAASSFYELSESTQTFKIRMIKAEAQHNAGVGEKLGHWKAVFREKGQELRAAVEEWQQKRAAEGAPRLTTGFLDGSSAIVDIYELKVRLAHMLQRLRALQEASVTARPVRLMPRLWISGAVEASSTYLLRHLGITHVLNATEDLLAPEPELGFTALRCPLRDVEEEDIARYFAPAAEFIDAGLASGGGVLVHCHAGRSRSCSLVLAWLMQRRRLTLKRALELVQRQRPEAAPNAGYVAALLQLEEQLFGQQTVKVRKTKPELKTCPECGARVGLSAESVRVHLRLKHAGSFHLSLPGSSDLELGSASASVASPRSSLAGGSLLPPDYQLSPVASGSSTSPQWRGTATPGSDDALLSPRAGSWE
eukprot:scaffold12.g7916.t1